MVAHLNYTDTTATPTQLRIVDSGKLHGAELVGTDTPDLTDRELLCRRIIQ